jgi:hypothetical protein
MEDEINPPVEDQAEFESTAQPEIQPSKPKKQVQRAQLNENTLLNQERGMKKLYDALISFNSSGPPEVTLSRLMKLYREWHCQLAPRFSFNFFITKLQTLGQKGSIRAHMSRIREIYKGRASWDDFIEIEDLTTSEDLKRPLDLPELDFEEESSKQLKLD